MHDKSDFMIEKSFVNNIVIEEDIESFGEIVIYKDSYNKARIRYFLGL